MRGCDMTKQKGHAVIGLIVSGWFILVISTWILNFIKLTDCDFKSPYKCEVIHAVGIIPPFSVATVWYNSEEE